MNPEQETLAAVWHKAKKPSRNAAMLTHNLRATFRFLETQWDDKARQIIGTLVAVNSSRMPTTIWAALFQQLRETNSLAIKVYILKQFANVCWTVPLAQGLNAFRTFALEIRPLLWDIQIVTNSAFQKHFSTIVFFLKSYAEEKLALDLFNTMYRNLVKWKQAAAIRAASSVIAQLVLRIPHCPPADELLRRAKKDMDFFGYIILLETTIAVDNNGESAVNPERLNFFCEEVDNALRYIAESFVEYHNAIPPCISSYRRLRSTHANWETAYAGALSNAILAYLESEKASKLLVCPFLQFLQTTSHTWPGDRNVILWQLTDNPDPFVRADAFLALASKAHLLDASEKRLMIAELMEKLRHFIEENCSYTIVAILKYLKVLMFHEDIPSSTQQLYLARLLHISCRLGNEFKTDTPAQLELLSLFAAAPIAPTAVQTYALKVFLEADDRAVAKQAFQTLINVLASSLPVAATLAFEQFGTPVGYLEGIFWDEYEEHNELASPFGVCVQNYETLSTVVHRRFLQVPLNNPADGFSNLVACDAVKQLCKFAELKKCSAFLSQHSTLTIVAQILLSHESMSSDVYVSLVQAAFACASLEDCETRANVSLFVCLMQHSWSVLIDCATSLHQEFALAVDLPGYRFFRSDASPSYLRNLITECKDVALSNEVPVYSSVFFQIIEGNIQLFAKCVEALKFSPLFMSEVMHALNQIFKLCDTFFHCTPKLTLRLLRSIFDTVVSFETVSKLGEHFLYELTTRFSKCCSSLVNRAVTLDFSSYCPDLCDFLLLCLQQDKGKSRGAFSELISNNWGTVADLVAFCRDISAACSTQKECEATLSLLRLMRCLCWSPYFLHIREVVSKEVIGEIAQNSEHWSWFLEREECRKIIFDLQSAFLMGGEAMHCVINQIICNENPPKDFFVFFEKVVDFFHNNDAQTQIILKQKLFEQHSGICLISLAAIDNFYLPAAVEFVLASPVEVYLLEFLLLVISECQQLSLSPLEFYVSDAVLNTANHFISDIITNYRWGWFAGPKTVKMLLSSARGTQSALYDRLVRQLGSQPNKVINLQSDELLFTSMWDRRAFFVKHYLHPGVSAIEMLKYVSSDKFHASSSAEEIIFSNSSSVLQLLRRFFVAEDDFEDLSDPQIISVLARFISTVPSEDLFLWELSEWASLLRSWVSVTLTTQPESEQWGWLQLSCWTLFYRFYNHVFLMARDRHPKYPKENGVSFFGELRKVYLQLSSCFLCCNAGSVDEVALFTVRYALKNNSVFDLGGIDDEIFWCIFRTCVEAVWLVLSKEQCGCLHDPEVIMFLCRAHAKIGLPLHIQRKVHTALTLKLHAYGTSNHNYDADGQRHALWLISSFGGRIYSLTARLDSSPVSAVAPPKTSTGSKERDVATSSAIQIQDPQLISEVKEYFDFRSSVSHDVLRIVQETLRAVTVSSPSAVSDNLEVLQGISQLTANSTVSLASAGSISEIEHVYFLIRDFVTSASPLSVDAPLQPTAHCLSHLLGQFPSSRRASAFSDEYALSLATTILGSALRSWLRRSASLAAPPAQVPCILAVYLPYLLRLDLPLYVAALGCVDSIVGYGATAEVEAVLHVVLTRLGEDVEDVQWSSQLAGGWYKALFSLLRRVALCVYNKEEQFTRQLWEGMWRGASSSDVCHSQDMQEYVQHALRQLIRDLIPNFAQLELSHLIVFNTSIQRKSTREDLSVHFGAELGSTLLPFHIVGDFGRSRWRGLLAETQATFAVHAAQALGADNTHSLLFEFDKAVEALVKSSIGSVTCVEEMQSYCFLRECVNQTLLPSTEAALSALNHFTFSSLERRRAVLHELCVMAANDSHPHATSEITTASWTGIYFDVMYERATCTDEGLWVACVLAAVEAGGSHLKWIVAALQSLIAASSTRRKRIFLRRAGKLAKRNETQGRVRDFFAGAGDRLSALHAPPAVWKSELLVEVTFVFST